MAINSIGYAEMSNNVALTLARSIRKTAQRAAHALDHMLPVADLPLQEQPRRRIPRAVLALEQPAEIRRQHKLAAAPERARRESNPVEARNKFLGAISDQISHLKD